MLLLICRSALQLFECAAQLVWAGSSFDATADAVELVDNVVNLLASHQLADALKVAIATAKEEHLLNDVVFIGCHVNQL